MHKVFFLFSHSAEVSLMEEFGLSEQHYNQVVSDVHVNAISSSYCEKWRLLHSHLQLEKIVVSDSDRNHIHEVDKRTTFFSEWKERKGSEATYRRLVSALLKTDRRQDAEGVCRILAGSVREESATGDISPVVTTSTSPTGTVCFHSLRNKMVVPVVCC